MVFDDYLCCSAAEKAYAKGPGCEAQWGLRALRAPYQWEADFEGSTVTILPSVLANYRIFIPIFDYQGGARPKAEHPTIQVERCGGRIRTYNLRGMSPTR